MSIFRTAKQVAFTELLVAVEETVNDYIDLAKVLDGSAAAAVFGSFVQARKTIIEKLETEMRLLGDLPSPPNIDKEDLGKLVHRVRAAFASDALHPALQELLQDEQRTLELARACEKEELNQMESRIVADLVNQVEEAITRLQAMATNAAV
ncbi:MAG: hypothetical protein V4628_10345 [Pseudomonadota bacterium]